LISVTYQFRFPYLRQLDGSLVPGLVIQLRNPITGAKTVETNAELDSGAEYSLFDGQLAIDIGLDIFKGKPFVFELANGIPLDARILAVVISHAELGRFNFEARFSTGPLRRNILGRDFFDLLQIGFDEHQSEIYLGATR
jgi:hypothetical protein